MPSKAKNQPGPGFPLVNSHPFGSARSGPGREAAKRTLDREDRSGIIQGEGKGDSLLVSINRYICIHLYCHRASSSPVKRLACQVAKPLIEPLEPGSPFPLHKTPTEKDTLRSSKMCLCFT